MQVWKKREINLTNAVLQLCYPNIHNSLVINKKKKKDKSSLKRFLGRKANYQRSQPSVLVPGPCDLQTINI